MENNNLPSSVDVAAILATLANLQQPAGTSFQNQQQAYDSTQSYEGYQHLGHTPPTQPTQQSLPYYQSADPRLANRPAPQPFSAPRPQDRASTPLIDPATITEWKQGLRCVSKIASQNADFAPSIRKLMKEQEGNVKQWEAGRERLIEDHNLKRENEETHRAALSLPGLLQGSPLLRTPQREKAELQQYDAKVYRACKAMTESQMSSLKLLGVPFFGVKHQLVLHESVETPSAEDAAAGKISRTQLLELQRKMLNHLTELYGE
ncbi:hypothetical protein CC86DRAFT_368732 [Ophiobolus disseminans]|uniref:Uncharacterized protein n=1 Tax=Ophiobolus disseminans TaxID=1469910 RepID=A0A6A7A704_9PLEO|nr:hypothetical protein CC86DRAFT_368732 [Ophiobolus disseminans]